MVMTLGVQWEKEFQSLEKRCWSVEGKASMKANRMVREKEVE
jgi:hypothetical protein